MVTINLKVSMCRDIIANSNMTKACVINPCDSCNNDVNTPLNAIHVHIYSDYVIHFECIYVHSTYVLQLACVIQENDYVMRQDSLMTSFTPAAHAQKLSN